MSFFKKTFYDVRCGLHSEIPKCCILWYITIWRKLSDSRVIKICTWALNDDGSFYVDVDNAVDHIDRKLGGVSGKIANKYNDLLAAGKFGYIACPRCLIFKFRSKKKSLIECQCRVPLAEETPWVEIIEGIWHSLYCSKR